MFLTALKDRTLIILMIAAVAVLVVDLVGGGNFIDGFAILLAVGIAAGVTAYNEFRAQAAFRSLQLEDEAFKVRCVRSGSVQLISAFDLVVGDVVELEGGHKIPADGVLVDGQQITCDESMLTGESEQVKKRPNSQDQVRAGTLVQDGRARMVVTSVGEGTEYGRLRAHLSLAQQATPLQERLSILANKIGVVGSLAAGLIFAALLLAALIGGQLSFSLDGARTLLTFVALAVTIVVVAVPEGLPVAVTISLAYSMRRMTKENSLVRRLAACETMGSAQVLCVDKTGTLTKNTMSVVRILAGENRCESNNFDLPEDLKALIAEISAVDSSAHISMTPSGRRAVGNATECALLDLLYHWNLSYEDLRKEATVLRVLEFTSERKRMSCVVKKEHGLRVLSKGAPEFILPLCQSILGPDGPRPLDDAQRQQILDTIAAWGEEGVRVLALAYRDTDLTMDAESPAESIESELVWVGLFGLGDPLRPKVIEAIRDARKAGVEVKIITGDNPVTAEAVARAVKLMGPNDLIIDGETFRAWSDEELLEHLPRLRVVARAVPTDKLRLVQCLQRSGKVVAVTGDGTNDAPALRHADVGLAMGKSGTDVAREASDIVILDDNFSTIVSAISWGRATFDNIRKFIQFQLTVSFVALAVAFIAGITGKGTPLTVVQLLWVNLIMDTLAALALATEAPTKNLLDRKPHGRHEALISPIMWTQIFGMGSIMLGVLLLALYTPLFGNPTSAEHHVFIFNLFVFLQIGNLINCRTSALNQSPLQGLRKAKLFLTIFVGIIVIQVLLIFFGGDLFNTSKLSLYQWLLCLGAGIGVVLVNAAIRAWLRSLPDTWPETVQRRALLTKTALLKLARPIRAWLNAPASQSPLGVIAFGGLVTLMAGTALRAIGREFAPWGFALFAAGLAAMACWAWEHRKMVRRRTIANIRLHALFSTVFFFLLVIIANAIAVKHYTRKDMTQERRYTLSPQTISVLDRIHQPIIVTTLFRPGDLSTDLDQLLREYEVHARHIEVRRIDPDRDPGEHERLISRLGLEGQPSSAVVIEVGDRHRVIYGESLVTQQFKWHAGRRHRIPDAPSLFRGEEAITSSLLSLSTSEMPMICFSTGHGERSFRDRGAEGLVMMRDKLRDTGFRLREIFLVQGGSGVPDECDLLITAGPRQTFQPDSLRAISAYLDRGGKWLLTVEPWETGGLESVLDAWGLGIRPVYLVDPTMSSAGISPTNIHTRRYQNHLITAGLGDLALAFPYATSVHIKEAPRPLETVNLALISEKGYAKTDRKSKSTDFDSSKDIRGGFSVLAAVNEPARLYEADGRRESARIVLAGDTDWLTNAHLPRVGNQNLLMNAVDWLAKREENIAVRAHPSDIRRIAMSDKEQRALYWFILGFLPGCIAVLGAAVAWRRRH